MYTRNKLVDKEKIGEVEFLRRQEIVKNAVTSPFFNFQLFSTLNVAEPSSLSSEKRELRR